MDNVSLSIKQIKAETLCWGIKLENNAYEQILRVCPQILNQKQIHAAHLFLNKRTPVNTVFGESFTHSSPYDLRWQDNEFWLYRNEEPCFTCVFRPSPKWYSQKTSYGNSMSEVFTVHGLRTLALSSYTRCDYVNGGEACKFCSVSKGIIPEEQRLNEIREVMNEAFLENPNYTVALSEGIRNGSDKGAVYHSKMVKVVKSIKPNANVSV